MMRRAIRTTCLSLCAVLGLLVMFPTASYASPSFAGAPVVASTSALNTTELSQKAASSWPWYVSRSAGLTAVVLLLLLALSGIGQLTGFSYRFIEPLMSWSLHRALAISFGVCVCIHGLALLFDRYEPFSIFQITVPFLYHYKSVKGGSLYLALGIIASYIAAVMIATSLFWINTKQKQWRLLHYLSYVLVALIFLHGLYLGTDIAHAPLRVAWWLGCIILGVGIISRLLRAGTIRQDRREQ